MSIDLVVQNPIDSGMQPVMDQNGNKSSFLISSSAIATIVGLGSKGATAALGLATYASTIVDVQIAATDLGQGNAQLDFLFLPNTGQPPYQTVLTLNPNANGGLVAPSMANRPSSGTADLTIDSDGNITPQTSSVRFKENVMPLADDFHKILALEPKTFNYRDSSHRAIGLIAEDVDSANLEGLVTYDGDGKPLSVHYKLIPLYLLELVKEQQRRLDEQERTMADLRAAVAADRTH